MHSTKKIKCPHCGHDDISKPKYSREAMAIGILLLGILIPFLSKKYFCFNCSKNFSEKEQKDSS